jgi:uncharacterized protein (TIGR02268 family)
VRVAANVATYLRFDAPIDKDSVEVEGRAARFRLVDPGERTLTLEPAVEPGAGEKLRVRVRYKDGASPAYATLALVSHPTRVDKEVEVVRHPRTPEAASARCETGGPAGLVLSGQLGRAGVQAMHFRGRAAPDNKSGLTAGEGTSYRATLWSVVAVRITNLPGQKPWVPGSARLFSAEGTPVRVRLVRLRGKSQLQPGESADVVVEADVPISSNTLFRLELLDAEGGRLLPIHEVRF